MRILVILCCFALITNTFGDVSEQVVEADLTKEEAKVEDDFGPIKAAPGKSPEDSIPVIEIKGEGKPMTAAQIRQLEEASEGKPLDIKVKHTWRPRECPRAAKRKDFITFHYKAFLEDNKKVDQTYGRGSVRMQLGVGMTMPGLDKGLKGMCDTELRKIQIPWRLSRKKKSKVWKYIPNEEHWLTLDIEMLTVEAWTAELQFQYMDHNNDSYLTTKELVKHAEKMRKEFGKHWPHDDIDNVMAAKYFVKYFDLDGDNKVTSEEYRMKIKEDMQKMSAAKKKPEGRRRDPGLAWILDFNNDGVVSMSELDIAADVLDQGPESLLIRPTEQKEKDEL